jgi:hypothetical protein
MPNYDISVSFLVKADSKIHAMELIKDKLGPLIEVELDAGVESDLFAELGVEYD